MGPRVSLAGRYGTQKLAPPFMLAQRPAGAHSDGVAQRRGEQYMAAGWFLSTVNPNQPSALGAWQAKSGSTQGCMASQRARQNGCERSKVKVAHAAPVGQPATSHGEVQTFRAPSAAQAPPTHWLATGLPEPSMHASPTSPSSGAKHAAPHANAPPAAAPRARIGNERHAKPARQSEETAHDGRQMA